MKDLYHHMQKIGIDLAFGLAGMFGVVAMFTKPNELTLFQKFIRFVIGVSSSVFITPLALYYLNLPNRLGFGVAFLIGYSGLKTVELIIKKFTKNDNN